MESFLPFSNGLLEDMEGHGGLGEGPSPGDVRDLVELASVQREIHRWSVRKDRRRRRRNKQERKKKEERRKKEEKRKKKEEGRKKESLV